MTEPVHHHAAGPVEALLALAAELHPDPVDVFEDLLAARLGLSRHPMLSQEHWRRLRVALIEATCDWADRLGCEFADKLLEAPEEDRP